MQQVILGDCIEELAKLAPSSVDMVLADMPYGTTRAKWDTMIPLEPLWRELKRVRRCGAAVVLFSAQPFTTTLNGSNLREFRYDLVWEKTMATGHLNAKKMPMRAHEHISVFYDRLPTFNPQKTQGHRRKRTGSESERVSTLYGGEKPRTPYDSTERYPRSVQRFSKDNRLVGAHPNQKPQALLRWLIATYTRPGDCVLDFCAGSGSTGVAAIATGRRAVLIEKDPTFWRFAVDAVEAACG